MVALNSKTEKLRQEIQEEMTKFATKIDIKGFLKIEKVREVVDDQISEK